MGRMGDAAHPEAMVVELPGIERKKDFPIAQPFDFEAATEPIRKVSPTPCRKGIPKSRFAPALITSFIASPQERMMVVCTLFRTFAKRI